MNVPLLAFLALWISLVQGMPVQSAERTWQTSPRSHRFPNPGFRAAQDPGNRGWNENHASIATLIPIRYPSIPPYLQMFNGARFAVSIVVEAGEYAYVYGIPGHPAQPLPLLRTYRLTPVVVHAPPPFSPNPQWFPSPPIPASRRRRQQQHQRMARKSPEERSGGMSSIGEPEDEPRHELPSVEPPRSPSFHAPEVPFGSLPGNSLTDASVPLDAAELDEMAATADTRSVEQGAAEILRVHPPIHHYPAFSPQSLDSSSSLPEPSPECLESMLAAACLEPFADYSFSEMGDMRNAVLAERSDSNQPEVDNGDFIATNYYEALSRSLDSEEHWSTTMDGKDSVTATDESLEDSLSSTADSKVPPVEVDAQEPKETDAFEYNSASSRPPTKASKNQRKKQRKKERKAHHLEAVAEEERILKEALQVKDKQLPVEATSSDSVWERSTTSGSESVHLSDELDEHSFMAAARIAVIARLEKQLQWLLQQPKQDEALIHVITSRLNEVRAEVEKAAAEPKPELDPAAEEQRMRETYPQTLELFQHILEIENQRLNAAMHVEASAMQLVDQLKLYADPSWKGTTTARLHRKTLRKRLVQSLPLWRQALLDSKEMDLLARKIMKNTVQALQESKHRGDLDLELGLKMLQQGKWLQEEWAEAWRRFELVEAEYSQVI